MRPSRLASIIHTLSKHPSISTLSKPRLLGLIYPYSLRLSLTRSSPMPLLTLHYQNTPRLTSNPPTPVKRHNYYLVTPCPNTVINQLYPTGPKLPDTALLDNSQVCSCHSYLPALPVKVHVCVAAVITCQQPL